MCWDIHALDIHWAVPIGHLALNFIGYSQEKSELHYLQKSNNCVGITFCNSVIKTNVVKKLNFSEKDEEEVQKYMRVTSSFWVGVKGKNILHKVISVKEFTDK